MWLIITVRKFNFKKNKNKWYYHPYAAKTSKDDIVCIIILVPISPKQLDTSVAKSVTIYIFS